MMRWGGADISDPAAFGGTGVVDRLRQRRQPDAGARGQTAKRNRRAAGAGRDAHTHYSPIADGKRFGRGRRRRARLIPGVVGAEGLVSGVSVAISAGLSTFLASLAIDLEPDYRVFGFTLLMALLAGMAAGLAPALQASRPSLTVALKGEGSIFGERLSQSRLRNA